MSLDLMAGCTPYFCQFNFGFDLIQRGTIGNKTSNISILFPDVIELQGSGISLSTIDTRI